MNLRENVARILEADHSRDRQSKITDITLMVLIVANVIATMLESESYVDDRFHHELFLFEIFSVMVFSVEYFLRVWSCPDLVAGGYTNNWRGRLRYMLTPMAVIDLLAIAPFYFSLLYSIDLRFLRVMRLLRTFKLTRYSPALQVMLAVLQKEAPTLGAAFFVLLILLVVGSSGIYLIEHQEQPDVFGSIPQAMWWALVTLTTVGYGDTVPITPLGKFFAGCIAIVGVGMVALPAAIMASGFSEELRSRRDQYKVFIKEAINDGVITIKEQGALERVRHHLGVSEADAELMQTLLIQRHSRSCPHCGKSLLLLDEESN